MKGKRLTLHLAFHHHQPIGNPEGVLEQVYQQCYLPLLQGLAQRSSIQVNLSYSAPVLRFLESRHPEYLELLRELIESERAELLATGFYEPVLADLPEDDRRGQLGRSLQWYEERFGQRPCGVWLSEAVWDKSLVPTFREMNLRYTLVRDERFMQAGLAAADLHGYYITEEIGQTLAVFPNNHELLKRVPFGKAEDLLAFLRRMANRSGITLTLADVAERWGAWPGTHTELYATGRLNQIWDLFEGNADWLIFRRFSHTLSKSAPQGRCYLPGGVNIDLGAWSLPDGARQRFYEARRELETRHDASRFLPFFRSGCWEAFRERYSEANLMNKKGLWLRRQLLSRSPVDPVAQEWLWEAQCNTAYWHGTAGGIYLPHLRQAVWQRLLATEARMEWPVDQWLLDTSDFDGDGLDEVAFYNSLAHLGFSPARGGTLFEWSLLPARHNLCNTLTRRHESAPLHQPFNEVSPEHGGAMVDAYDRRCFHDHIISRHLKVEDITSRRFGERGNLIGQPYRIVNRRTDADGGELVLEGTGFIEQGGEEQAVRVRKTFRPDVRSGAIHCDIALTNESPLALDGVFGVECNFSLAPQQETVKAKVDSRPPKLLGTGLYAEGVTKANLGSQGAPGVEVSSTEPFFLWALPLNTRQAGENSEVITQGHLVLTGWSFRVAPGEDATFHVLVTPTRIHETVPPPL